MSDNNLNPIVVNTPPAATEAAEAPETQEAAPATEAPKKAEDVNLKKALKKVPIKYNGKSEDIEYDPEDTDFLAKQFQMAKLGQSKAQEYANLEKEVQQFVAELRKNPRKVLSDPNLGLDMKQIAAQILEEEIENSKKTPEQLDREKLESELKSLKDEQQKREKEWKDKEFQRVQEQEFIKYDTMITQSLEKSDLPKSPYIVKKMADYMLLGLQNNLDLNADDVLPLVRQEMQTDLKEMFQVMPDEVIEALVGKDVITRIRKKSVAKAKAAQPPTPISKSIKDSGQSKPKEAKAEKKQTFKEFFKV